MLQKPTWVPFGLTFDCLLLHLMPVHFHRGHCGAFQYLFTAIFPHPAGSGVNLVLYRTFGMITYKCLSKFIWSVMWCFCDLCLSDSSDIQSHPENSPVLVFLRKSLTTLIYLEDSSRATSVSRAVCDRDSAILFLLIYPCFTLHFWPPQCMQFVFCF